MKKIFFILVALFFSFFTPKVDAEIKIYEGIGEFPMVNETMDFAKNKAKLEAQRNISEKIFVYVQNHSKTQNAVLDHDEIITLSESLMKIVNVKYNIEDNGDFFNVRATVKAEIDTDDIEKIIKNFRKE